MTNPQTTMPEGQSLRLLTIPETAKELRCSRAHVYNILRGTVEGLPPLPVFHLGRRVYIRATELREWIGFLEHRERERQYATGDFGMRDEPKPEGNQYGQRCHTI